MLKSKILTITIFIFSNQLLADKKEVDQNHTFDCGIECEQQFNWLRKYARNGSPRAQTLLAISYKTGEYGSVNSYRAWKWIRRAKRQLHAPALYISSQWYRKGYDTEVDIDKADSLLERAAEMNFAPAVLDLAKLMYNAKKNEAAYLLLEKAASFGLTEAKIIIDKVKPKIALTKVDMITNQQRLQKNKEILESHSEGELITIFANEQDPFILMGNMLTDIKSTNIYEKRGTTGSRLSDIKCGQSGSGCNVITRETLERSGL